MATCSVPSCDRAVKTRGWCHAHYMRWWYTGDVGADRPISDKNASIGERFQKFVDRSGDCWVWTGTVNRTGYAYFSIGGKPQLAHRVAYTLAYGEPPAGQQVDHLCHNRDKTCRGGWGCLHRRCVNPQHLGLATQSENLQRSGRCADRAKERSEAITHCPYGHLKEGKGYCAECRRAGQRAKSLKSQGKPDPRRLDATTVEQVKALLATGRTHAQIAAETGASMATISRIRNGGSWFAPR